MEGLSFKYRNNIGSKTAIKTENPQYLFLEPYESVVVRYYITKDGLEDNKTSIVKQSVDKHLIVVKLNYTKNPFLSKFTDFNDKGEDVLESVNIEFLEEDEELYLDVLYQSLTSNRLRVKVSVFSEQAESFENENTVSDGPDQYVRMSNVQIKHDAVYFTYIYRRSGRLQKYTGKAEYSILAQILKDRLFKGPSHVDFEYPKAGIETGIRDESWSVHILEKEIRKPFNGRFVIVTDEELGDVIREKASIAEILGLLQTTDLRESSHILRKQAENFLTKCDRECSLPAASLTNSTDTRGQ